MSSRTAKHFFEDVRAASQDATRCRTQLLQLEAMAKKLGSSTFEPRVRGSKAPDLMADRVCSYVSREEQLSRRMELDYETIAKASKLLYGEFEDGKGGLCAHLSAKYADVCYHRYVADETWRQVAMAVGYSVRPCQLMHNHALKTIDELDLLTVISA